MTDTAPPRRDLARYLFLAGAILALSHLANEWVNLAQPWGPAWKASGIVLLGLYALSRKAWPVGIGLLLSATGDVLLELDGLFVFGMAAFGLAHISYIVAFAGVIRREGVNQAGWIFAALVIFASLGLGLWFVPGMADLLGPGLAYQLIISVMVAIAMLSKAPLLARLGAVVFMMSDSLIAVERFAGVTVLPGAVWITYAAAQIMIAWGLTRAP
jgi:uncharacterized membrane protein YhhN